MTVCVRLYICTRVLYVCRWVHDFMCTTVRCRMLDLMEWKLTITLFVLKQIIIILICDLQVPAFREIAKNYLTQLRGGGENQNEHSDDEETETRADEN